MNPLSAGDRVRIFLELHGGPEFRAQADVAAASLGRLEKQNLALNRAFLRTNKSSFLFNQLMFTARRLVFYTTLGTLALIGEVVKLGFSYNSTMQQARVAFSGFLPSAKAVNDELHQLYILAARTPFQFSDIVIATRRILPFTHNLKLTNNTVKAILDSLSAIGVLTPAALNRASLALAHMFAIGRLTGQILYQLSRDNIPMQKALQDQYHMTGLQIRQMVASGLVTAQQAARALFKEMQMPGYKNAALNQATKTLQGAWSTFKDILSMASATSTAGIFGGLQSALKRIDINLLARMGTRATVSITDVANAIDSTLSPSTHIIINLFYLFDYALKSTIATLYVFIKAIQILLIPLNTLGSLFGINKMAMKTLGVVLGILVGLSGIYITRLMVITLWTDALRISTLLLGKAMILYEIWVLRAEYAQLLLQVAMGVGVVLMGAFTVATGLALTALDLLAGGFFNLAIAIYATPIIGWALLLVGGLITLYFTWTRFHNAVNDLFSYIYRNKWVMAGALTIAFGPIGAVLAAIVILIAKWKELKHLMSGGSTQAKLIQGPPPKGTSSWHGLFPTSLHGIIPGFATGGTMPHSGLAMVGEHGREIVNLPRGATVTPIGDAVDRVGSLNITVVPQGIYLNGKQIGQVVADVKTDKAARQ